MPRIPFAVLSVVAAAALVGCSSHGGEHGEHAKEVAVTMNEVPPAVRATLDREAAGGKVTEIEKEMKKGHTVYSADLLVHGEAWDITVAEDGTVVSKEREKAGD
jgi:hypothetical protein